MDQDLKDALDAVTASVATVKGTNASILEFIKTGIPAVVQAAVDKAAALGATPEELQPFTDVGKDLTASAQEILDAIHANDPTPLKRNT